MPRVTRVAKCRRSPGNCMGCGDKIKKGAAYKWWKFRRGGMRVRCDKPECAPKPWDLTQSDFYSALYRLQDNPFTGTTAEELEANRDDTASALRDLGQEQRDKKDNMPQGLQDADTGMLLEERADACDSCADELEGVDCSVEEKEEGESDEDYESRIESRISEIREELESALGNISV